MGLYRENTFLKSITKKSMTIFGGKHNCINVGEEMVDAVADLGVEFPHPDAQDGEPPEVRVYKRQLTLGLDEMTHTTSGEN